MKVRIKFPPGKTIFDKSTNDMYFVVSASKEATIVISLKDRGIAPTKAILKRDYPKYQIEENVF